MYDPTIGRFLSRDPRGPALCDLDAPLALNRYTYADDDPVDRVDPLGQKSQITTEPATPPDSEQPPVWCFWVWTWSSGVTQVCLPFSPPTVLPARRAWSCTASCNVEGSAPQCVNRRVTGAATGPSQELACREAKRAATQSAPAGCYARHCQCTCSRG